MKVDADRIQHDLEEFAEIGATGNGGVTRLGYTEAEDLAHGLMSSKLSDYDESCDGCPADEGYSDQVAVTYGRMRGDSTLSAIAIVSHLDTVPNGGKLDGTFGVVAGIEVMRVLRAHKYTPRHPLQVIAFRCEESSRFGRAFIGSSMVAGKFEKIQLDTLHDVTTKQSLRNSIREGMSLHARPIEFMIDEYQPGVGSKLTNIHPLAAMLELHIEQGPVLEQRCTEIGIVTSIAKATRLRVTITGRAAHSGTTPLELREDALLEASYAIQAVRRIAQTDVSIDPNSHAVATVGTLRVEPNAMNVVPSKVVLGVDIRAATREAVARLRLAVMDAIMARCPNAEIEILEQGVPVALSQDVMTAITRACLKNNTPPLLMPSGAGHDCMNFADQYPVGMIFVPSEAGISHSHEEHTSIEQLTVGVQVLLDTVLELDRSLP